MPIAALILAFVLVLLLVTRRVALWISLSAAAITLGLVSGMSPGDLASSAAASLASPRTISLVLSVAAITTLAEVLKRYGLLAALVRSITCLLGRADLAVMAVPSIIGALPVQGGAILSAPMVDGLGSELGLGPKHKAAVNLIFRHVWYFIAPFSPSLILGAQLAGVELGRLILWHVPFTLAAVTVGYLVVVRGAARRSGPASRPRRRLTRGQPARLRGEWSPGSRTARPRPCPTPTRPRPWWSSSGPPPRSLWGWPSRSVSDPCACPFTPP